jgi:hypothetical protein
MNIDNKSRKRKAVTKQQVKEMILSRSELKKNVGTTTGVPAVAGAMVYKSTILQDDSFSGRTGDQIRPSKMDISVLFSDTANNGFRVIIVQDTESYTAAGAPTVSDILAAATYISHHNPIGELNSRFKYLFDRSFDVSATGKQLVTYRTSIDMKGVISFSGTGDTSASCGKNAIWMAVIGFAATGGYTVVTTTHFRDS